MSNIKILNIYLTSKCNLDCSYCFVDKNNNKHITVDFERNINNLNEIKNSNIPHISITGGEPTLSLKINTIINLFKDKKITLLTNGLIFFNDLINIDNVIISLDGTKKSMLENRNVSFENYEIILKNIYKYISKPINTTISTVITEKNLSNFNDIYDIFKNTVTYSIAPVFNKEIIPYTLNQSSYKFLTHKIKYLYEKYDYKIDLSYDIISKKDFFANFQFNSPIFFPSDYFIEQNIYKYMNYEFNTLNDLKKSINSCSTEIFKKISIYLKNKPDDFLFSPYGTALKLT